MSPFCALTDIEIGHDVLDEFEQVVSPCTGILAIPVGNPTLIKLPAGIGKADAILKIRRPTPEIESVSQVAHLTAVEGDEETMTRSLLVPKKPWHVSVTVSPGYKSIRGVKLMSMLDTTPGTGNVPTAGLLPPNVSVGDPLNAPTACT